LRQRTGNDCGPAVLAALAASYGQSVDYDALVAQFDLLPDGTDLLALSHAAQRLGFATRGVRVRSDALGACPLPALAHLRLRLGGGHFVLLEGVSDARVTLFDPARGRRDISRRAFSRRFSGYLLLVEPLSTGWAA
jgi:ABC-type bacteriocin/lantibiotic exporter with double-glycine peptidase domain